MASNNLVGSWSTGIWESLGSPVNLSALTLSGYAVQPNTLGTLNARLGTCYSGVAYSGTGSTYDASPDLTNKELAIIEGLFLVGWYNQLAFSNMGYGGSSIPWTRIREADESIERASPVNIGKEYREMSKQAGQTLTTLINAYLDNDRGTSATVDFLNPAYPYIGANNAWATTQRSLLGPGA